MRQVIISGLPRSGTSWVGKAMSFAPGFTYYREPDNSDHVKGAAGREWWYRYLKAGDDVPQYSDHMDRALVGKVATKFTMVQNPGPIMRLVPRRFKVIGEVFPFLYIREPDVVVKLERASLKLDWLAARYPQARIVSLVRHPGGQFLSFKQLGWEPEVNWLLSDERLMEEYLSPFADVMRSAKTFWEKAGAFWGAHAYVALKQTQNGARHHFVPFEWLCADGPARLRELSDRLGMTWTAEAQEFAAPGSGVDGPTYSLRRDSIAQIDKWRKSVEPADIEACRAFAEPFGLPIYADFDPWKAEPLWSSAKPE
ncbi:MAG: sulfotransferase [Novosphingobium sp.]|nr:sulfotransferase [Novosphingobium sp.]